MPQKIRHMRRQSLAWPTQWCPRLLVTGLTAVSAQCHEAGRNVYLLQQESRRLPLGWVRSEHHLVMMKCARR